MLSPIVKRWEDMEDLLPACISREPAALAAADIMEAWEEMADRTSASAVVAAEEEDLLPMLEMEWMAAVAAAALRR